MANPVSDHGPWEVEEINGDQFLFYRVAKDWLDPNELRIHPGVFREFGGSMSCDWEKYSSAQETRARTGKPNSFGIIRLKAGTIRTIDCLTLTHDPDFPRSNRAHSAVYGLGPSKGLDPIARSRLTGMRFKLAEFFPGWEVEPVRDQKLGSD